MTARSHTRTMHKRKKKIAGWRAAWLRRRDAASRSLHGHGTSIQHARLDERVSEQERKAFWNEQ